MCYAIRGTTLGVFWTWSLGGFRRATSVRKRDRGRKTRTENPVRQWLAPAHLALTLVIIVWNVVQAGRIAQMRQTTRTFATVTGLAGLLLIPAFIVAVATTTVITGRAISSIDWLWPATIVLFTTQAVYALVRRLVNPLWGYPIAFYDILLSIAAVSRFFA